MGLTKSEQWTLCFVVGLILAGFLVQVHRARGIDREVWIEPASGWSSLTSPELRADAGGFEAPPSTIGSSFVPPSAAAPPGHELGPPFPQSAHGARINLNSASPAELELLPGIGPVKAQAIAGYRSQIRGFSSVDQLEQVKGIGPKTLSRIRPLVTLGGWEAAPRGASDVLLPAEVQNEGHTPEQKGLAQPSEAKVNINEADARELQTLKGIGPALASRIIDERKLKRFESPEDLVRVKGIGPAILDRLRPHIAVE